MTKENLTNYIEKERQLFIDISDKVWDLAETGLQETKTAEFLTGTLEKEGFEVSKGVADMPTAFTATYGNGAPVIGILGEYDALPGLSQEPVPYRKPVKDGANGQGCGHNMLGTAGIAAAFALKKEIEAGNLKGTVRYYGCPAEEKYNAKGWMVQHGLFKDVDIGLTWHPMSTNAVWQFSTNAINKLVFNFRGITAHAAGDPWNGRSALDAVELTNVGVNYLREHIIPDARVHYVITDGGGAPNVVPATASVYYYIRSPTRKQVDELHDRVVKVAKGAAMMTETELEVDVLSPTYNTRENSIVQNQLYLNMKEIGADTYTEDELSFATKLQEHIDDMGMLGMAKMIPDEFKEMAQELLKKPICDVVLPPIGKGMTLTGSTDVADVSWNLPLGEFSTATFVIGSPAHSWQNVAAGRMSIGHKGMIYAAKIMATTAFDFITDEELVNKAKAEFQEQHEKEAYESPFPDGHRPPFHILKPDILQYD